ncbi:MAG: tRNA pseudouridine(38-40) synthase TruA [Nitrospirota bacterium]|nr:tRNA pseudouridine(38-40) synthase TruA [Nitrospirota bacterium]
MKKFKLLLEYDGTAYQGWQVQENRLTIQGVIEDRIFKITGEQSRVIGASRTDAGVHALGQVAAFRTESRFDPETIKKALNALLPQDIRVLDASEVDDSFNPRDSAVKKSYFYIIANQRESSAFLYRYAWLVQQQLNLKSMIDAAQILIGEHDFSSFRGTGSSTKNPVREVFSLSIERFEKLDFMTASLDGKFIKLRIEANGFLRHMVRNIVGTLVEIGRGRFTADRIQEILESRDRKLAGPTAPARGLSLERIVY